MNKKLTVDINAQALADWNAARRRRGLTQKQALEQMMKEWVSPVAPVRVVYTELTGGKKRGLFDRIWR